MRANNKYGITIPWYIMTSKENNDETIAFLEKNEYFGYPKEYVKIFEQEELPLLSNDGKLLIGEDMLIKKASNGNGGVFNSMLKKGIIADMERKKIEWVFIGAVDNVLLKLVDLPLMGLAIKNGTDIATKTVLKKSPEEKVGVFCKQNGKVKIIEYTEIPEEAAIRVNEHGELIFGESNILSNLFSMKAVKKASTKELIYHVAHKAENFIDENGNLIKPKEPNCYKFEKFIFDAFNLFDNISILRGVREKDFAPIKNAKGSDSPETAKILYDNYWGNH
ncbi:MAG: UTP--glucose-1-phosphate uridylyltransferase [Firmicutes bacterium]|nr:UTP--glucose-1-phosphate uridylyltransferase [Bacillota bacterium]